MNTTLVDYHTFRSAHEVESSLHRKLYFRKDSYIFTLSIQQLFSFGRLSSDSFLKYQDNLTRFVRQFQWMFFCISAEKRYGYQVFSSHLVQKWDIQFLVELFWKLKRATIMFFSFRIMRAYLLCTARTSISGRVFLPRKPCFSTRVRSKIHNCLTLRSYNPVYERINRRGLHSRTDN